MPFHPTTTVAALVGNNTSAYTGYVYTNTDSPSLIPSSHTIKSNFYKADGVTLDNALWDRSKNLSPTNISRESLAAMLAGKLQIGPSFLWIPWWGQATGTQSNHINVGYNQAISSAEATKQVADMKARGGIACIDFYNTLHGPAQNYFRDACVAAGLPFYVMLDSNMSPAVTTTSGLNTLMDTLNSTYFNQPGYVKFGGQPLVVDFGFEGFGSITWSSVRSHISGLSQGNPLWLGRFTGPSVSTRSGFLDGFYGWPSPSDTVTAYLGYINSHKAAHPTLNYLAPIFKGFYDKLTVPTDDTSGNWTVGGALRVIAQNNGLVYRQCIDNVLASTWLGVMVATWNDYEEGTAIETGVGAGANLGVTPTITGNTLSWSLAGTASCIAKYRVWASLDGINVGQIGSDTVGTSLDLTTAGLDAGTAYSVFVQAIGIPSVTNSLSSPVTWTSPAAPVVSPSGGGTVVVVPPTVTTPQVILSDIVPMDWNYGYFSKGAQVANPPMYVIATPVQGKSGSLTRLLCYDLVLKAWTILDLPYGIATLTQIRSSGTIPITLVGGWQDGCVRRVFAGDQTWDGTPVAWSLRSAEVFGATASDRTYFRRILIRGTVLTAPASLTAQVQLSGLNEVTYLPAKEVALGSGQFQVEVPIGQTSLNAHVTISGTGVCLIEEISWGVLPKPSGVPVTAR